MSLDNLSTLEAEKTAVAESTHFLLERLNKQHQTQRFRERRVLSPSKNAEINYAGKDYLSFSSNDYLGLSTHPLLIKSLQTAAETYGVGSGSSALISGYSPAHQAVELAFADYLQRDRAIYFANGYMANLGVITALMQQRSDVIYQDKLNHASLIDAALLSKAKLLRYSHQNLHQLAALLEEPNYGERLIVSESVFSMDGSLTDLNRLAELAEENHALLMMDDAHGIGILGKDGRSVAASLDQKQCPIIVCPLGKAFGCYGAIVAGSHMMIENILQFARTYTYTTATPPALAATALSALQLVKSEQWRREKLQDLIAAFREEAKNLGLNSVDSFTAIQTIIVGDSAKAVQLSQSLLEQALFVREIRPPTVAEGSARLRITLNIAHTEADIKRLLNALAKEITA